ncbi:MAG: histidinol dehydrogenase, partial [Solirubrobacterales bacterium]
PDAQPEEDGGAGAVEPLSPDLPAAAGLTSLEVENQFAPEHLQVATGDPEAVLEGIEHSGEVLLGQGTPFSFANYLLGVPAALPTSGFARVTGGVTAETFLKEVSIGNASPEAVGEAAGDLINLAEHEGFPAHAEAIRLRQAQGD